MANNPIIKGNTNKLKHRENQDSEGANGDNPEIWATFDDSFKQVQSVLDRNRVLIQQVNDNHQSRVHDNMVKNVALIQELNGNISKVVSLYSDFSSNFSTVFNRHDDDGEGPKNGD
ncbi:Protein EARLY FLOWERING 4 [Hibiscus syriacus]|uniref:Protein EARLY FLOWERING 4 n=1 Tax=Hibiscus syriacus TaxID=106335 RepID=A0A6A3AWJ5_HIBSY|nr:protein EARLY FLOWERING 4-like [Hibiscus syriacus]KAE8708971.1 Protein EARLY FLOWERING 4 [Hibiscus syriacus]